MDAFKKWLFGTPEGGTVKIILMGLIGIAVNEFTKWDNPWVVVLVPAILVPVWNYLSTDFKGYGRGSE